MLQEITVDSLMTRQVTKLSPGNPLPQAIDLMVSQRLSCILVTENNTPVGIITERDLVKVLHNSQAHQNLQKISVAEVMTSPIITLKENDSFYDAIVVSRAEKIRHLPVINASNELVGLVSHTDLTNAYVHIIELQAEQVENSVAEKTRDLAEKNQELLLLSMEDHLMCIGNRRAMEADLQHTHEQAIRNQQDYTVILIDVDYFKNYNDHYGHSAGDEALKQTSKQLKTATRGSDRLYRYGGEEILILLPGCTAEQAYQVAQRHIKNLANLNLPHEKSPFEKLTASAGIGYINPTELEGKTWQEVVEQADEYLYKAKQAGRNQVMGES
ncbi:MAG: diguanylate cyclase [Pseudomonadales bacterium]